MTSKEIRDHVMHAYKEGQTVTLWMRNPEKEREYIQTKVKIIKFYGGHVLTEMRGFKSSIPYLEMLQLAKKPGAKNKPAVDVSRLIKRQQLRNRSGIYAYGGKA